MKEILAPVRNKRASGEFVRTKRESMNLSQSELATMAGTTQSYVSKVEIGSREPTLNIALNLCDALHADINEFVQSCK